MAAFSEDYKLGFSSGYADAIKLVHCAHDDAAGRPAIQYLFSELARELTEARTIRIAQMLTQHLEEQVKDPK